jgi:hypothetical protein
MLKKAVMWIPMTAFFYLSKKGTAPEGAISFSRNLYKMVQSTPPNSSATV